MEQLLDSSNFYGILIESLRIIFSWKKIFSQITIATIFPLSLLSLAHAHISNIHETGSFKNPKMSFWFIKIVYVVFFLTLSLFSTSTVVYAVARIYTMKEACFGEIMNVVPRVWKRLMITFGWSFLLILFYNMATFLLLYPLWGSMEGLITGRIAISGPILVIYMMGFVYISMVWHLACVVSVLEEECCGVEAMVQSQELVKGKMVISYLVFLVINLCFVMVQVVIQRFVLAGEVVWSRIGWWIGCLFLLSGFTLLGLVSQTLVYFTCKLYHCEMIYVSSSHLEENDHLKVHFGDYAPLGGNDVQQLDQC